MFKEFKEFAIKGNVVDMAVGIIVGAAFTTVVKSIVDDLIMPVVGVFTGRVDFSNKFVLLRAGAKTPPPYHSLKAAKDAGANVLSYGQFINAVVSFLIVSFVLFLVVRWVNRLRRPETPPAPTMKACPYCKSQIDKDATRCAHCTAQLDVDAAA